MTVINDMYDKRKGLHKSMTDMLDVLEKEKREFTAEENAQYTGYENDLDSIGEEIKKAQDHEARKQKLSDVADSLVDTREVFRPEPDDNAVEHRASKEYTEGFRELLFGTPINEIRALQGDSDTVGGYTVVPVQWVNSLIKAADDAVFMRQLAEVVQVPKAQSLGYPSLDNDPADPTWTAEILVGNEDSTMSFGSREFYPHPLAQYIKVSKKLVRSSGLNIDALVRERLGYKANIVEETAFLEGTGNNQPLGVFTASAQGISTGRDVSTGNTDTAIQPDNLIRVKYTLKSNYWKRARWIFHRDAVRNIRLLKDGDGQYLWKAGISNDKPDTIMDFPVIMSEYAPNAFTSGLYVGILGDFSKYIIADALDMSVQVLLELYAITNQNAYILRKETDGMPTLEEAFVRVALA